MRYRACLSLTVVLLSAAALAQGPGGPVPGSPPEQMGPSQGGMRRGWQGEAGPMGPEARELLEQVFVARLSRRLQLSDEQTVLMVRQYTEHRERMQALRQERTRIADRLRRLAEEHASETETMEVLGKLQEIDRDLALARFAIFEQMSAGLAPEQRANLYLFVGDFENELRRWVTQVHRRRFEQGLGPVLGPEGAPEPGLEPPPREGGPRFRDGDTMRRPGARDGQGRGPMPPQGPGGREPLPPQPPRGPDGQAPVPPGPPQPPPPPAP